MAELNDAFGSGTIDEQWIATYGGGTMEVSGGELVFGITELAGGQYSSVASMNAYDLTNCRIAVALRGAFVPKSTGFVHFSARNQAGQLLELAVVSGNIEIKRTQNATLTVVSRTPYDPAVHAYLGFRHAQGVAFWETSSDGVEFRALQSDPDPIPLDDVTILIGAGTFKDSPVAPGTASFDDLKGGF